MITRKGSVISYLKKVERQLRIECLEYEEEHDKIEDDESYEAIVASENSWLAGTYADQVKDVIRMLENREFKKEL
jgi:hypothetical protein